MEIQPVAIFHSPFASKFGIPKQSGIIEELKGEIVFEAAILDSVIESSAAALGALACALFLATFALPASSVKANDIASLIGASGVPI